MVLRGHRDGDLIGVGDPASTGGSAAFHQPDWYRIPYPARAEDALVLEERRRDRIRLLLGRNGILFRIEPEDPAVVPAIAVLHHLFTRRFQPLRRITVESINGTAASKSKYGETLGREFDVVVDMEKIVLYRKRA